MRADGPEWLVGFDIFGSKLVEQSQAALGTKRIAMRRRAADESADARRATDKQIVEGCNRLVIDAPGDSGR